jgi:hypothetical protein
MPALIVAVLGFVISGSLDVESETGTGPVESDGNFLESVSLGLNHVLNKSALITDTSGKLTSPAEEELDDNKGHVDRIVLVSNRRQGNSVDPSDVGSHDLVDGVPNKKTFTSHRVGLDFGRVRPKDRVGKVEDCEVKPDKDDGSDRGAEIGLASFGVDSTDSSVLVDRKDQQSLTWKHRVRQDRPKA